MLGGVHAELLFTVALVFLALSGTECRAKNDLSSVLLPEWSVTSEYVVQCFSSRDVNMTCDWTRSQRTAPGDVEVNTLGSHSLEFVGKACLEFWYLAPVASNGSDLHALLKSSSGLVEVWASPPLPRDAWRQLSVSLNINESGTRVVFEAVQPVSVDQKTLRQIGVRRGSCGNQCDSNTELWTDDSTRCLCSFGQLFCFPFLCPKNQICGPQSADFSVTATSGICTIHSPTFYTTFDGVVFHFTSPCSYVLSKTCSPTETLPTFRVEVVNMQNDGTSLPTIQQIVVELGGIRVSLLKSQTSSVVVNGVWRWLPLSLNNGTIYIKSNPAAVVLKTNFGLSVSYDIAGDVHVAVPFQYSDHVCGLCGNFNLLPGDDFYGADGTPTENVSSFAESWQTETVASCEAVFVPQQCDPLEETKYGSEQYCGHLVSSTGPFADCLPVLGAESYFRACVSGMCSAHGDPSVVCKIFQEYADNCHKAGVAVLMWRNSTYCPIQCSENSHYNSCASGCPEVCSMQDLTNSCGTCTERCVCYSGFKLSGGRCVPADHCGCWYRGKHYVKGETFVEGNCAQQCQCMGHNATHCTAMQCGANEICKEKDAIKGCFPLKPATCSIYGDPHYITFDNSAYDFQGGCSYTLTTTCGGQSSVQFTVTAQNMYPSTQNFTRSKIQAVSLHVDDLYLTLNQSGEVHVYHGHVGLPYSINGTYGSVWVYKKRQAIILETTFGLKMGMDGHSRLFLQVDERYKYELCGLCGTYSGYQGDDFMMPGEQMAADVFEFADSWRVNNNDGCIAHPNDPRECVGNEEDEANGECFKVLGDAFQACHEHIHPSIYISSCVYDYCATSGDKTTLCESLKSYVAACQVEGVELPNWWIGTACADPLTTRAPTPHPTSPDQTSCPLNCNFDENICGWEQLIQDSFDWTRHSGPTSSNLTGPNQDHTTGDGFYMYIEGDDASHGDSARLLSSVCHHGGPLCLHFWYYMDGSATSMALNIYLLQNNEATKLWSVRNNQGPQWHLANVDLKVYYPFRIIVEGIRGSNAQSDVAIDDTSISFGACSNPPNQVAGTVHPLTSADVLSSHPICNLDCNFDGSLCAWDQMITDAFDWTIGNGSTPTLMTGPSTDHTGGGDYLYIEASSTMWGDAARLISSECSSTGPQCLQFWYHIYGSADTMGLTIYLLESSGTNAIWRKNNNQGNLWHLAQVDLNTTGAYQIIIEGRRGSNHSDVAIDDIKRHPGHCSDLSGEMGLYPTKPALHTNVPITATSGSSVIHVENKAPEPPALNVVTHQPELPALPNGTTVGPQPPALPNGTTVGPQPPALPNGTTVGPQPPALPNGTTVGPQPPALPNGTTVGPQPPALPNGTTVGPPNVHSGSAPLHQPVCQLDCDFEQHLCQWSQLLTDVFDWEWHNGSTPSVTTGPSSDHSTGEGHYIYIEANRATLGDTARLISSECSDPGPQCLQFWYHMYGSADTMGLHVYLLQNKIAESVWRKRNNQGNKWHLAQVNLVTTGTFQVIFEGRRGSTDQSDVAIDDLSFHRGFCPDLAKPTCASVSSVNPSLSQPETSGLQPPTLQSNEMSVTQVFPTNKPGSTNGPPPQMTNMQSPATTKLESKTNPQNPGSTNVPTSHSDIWTTNKPRSPEQQMLVPTPSCARNSHYTTCIPTCSPTCTHLYGPPHCRVSDICVAGCVCDDGYIQRGRKCVPVQECGCMDTNGTKHHFNEVWYTNHCSQKCKCNNDGKGRIDCNEGDCDSDEVCLQNEFNTYYCESTGFSECTLEEGSVYKTFDKLKHDFKGTDLYVLVRTKNLPSNLPDIYIEGTNACSDNDESSEEQYSQFGHKGDSDEHQMQKLQELKIQVYNLTVELKQECNVFVDGQQIKTPVSPTPGLSIHEHSSRIFLRTDFGLSVEFNVDCKADIILPHLYRRRVEGLCGNFDGRKGNDKVKPDGTMARNIQEFRESWRV